MKIKTNILFMILTSLCVINTASFAAQHERGAGDLRKWEGAYWKTCQGFNIGNDNPCIGASFGKCTAKSIKNPSYGDEYGILLMVARETTVGGANFCPIMINGRNKNRGNAWTTYHNSNGSCVWLCREGYTGEKCTEPTSNPITKCDTTKLLQTNYSGTRAVGSSSSNIEDGIPNWGANYYLGCGLSKGQEHDLILAISNWLPSGRGAFVRPYIVRAERSGWDDMISWIDIYPAAHTQYQNDNTEEKLACKIGFKPNSTKTDCEPINKDVCGIKDWCSGWVETNLKKNIHEEKMFGKCYQWRCKDTTQGLDKVGGTSCSSCGTTPMDGVNPANGTCVHCEDGKFFNDDAEKTGYCVDTYYLDRTKLMYGDGSQATDIDKQCWTIDDIDEYKKCVLGESFVPQKELNKNRLGDFKLPKVLIKKAITDEQLQMSKKLADTVTSKPSTTLQGTAVLPSSFDSLPKTAGSIDTSKLTTKK